jgi:transposase
VPGGDAHGLLALLRRVEARTGAEAGTAVPVAVCFEAGYDGFWLARYLRQRGIRT